MIQKGIIIFLIGVIFWFLAGSSFNDRAVLGPIYGSTWQAVFMTFGAVGLGLMLFGFIKTLYFRVRF